MMIGANKLKIPWNCFQSKILAIRKTKKVFQNGEKGEEKVLISIYFDKGVDQIPIIDLGVYIWE